jgi:hypothetical protein
MSKIEVDQITQQSGTTLTVGGGACKTAVVDATTVTLGRCGGSVALASGASQTGFGRTGTVDWQTGSIKTSDFTAVNTQGFFVDTNGGAVVATLPAGSAGAIISFQDYRNTFDTNPLTIQANGSEKINGGAGAVTLGTEGEGITLVYIDGTIGWRSIQDNDFAAVGSNFISATGGTETTCGDFKIHTFTGPGNFQVTAGGSPSGSSTLEYIVVAGGGGGGGGYGGGGGAGGFRFASPSLAPLTYPGKPLAAPAGLTATVNTFPITIGAGGTGSNGAPNQDGTQGSASIFSSITSAGGGAGGMVNPVNSLKGGSGGGGSVSGPGGAQTCGGAGNTPPVSPPQGQNGGDGFCGGCYGQGGGGGAIVAGTNGTGPAGGAGGNGAGIPTAFGSNGQPSGSYRYYAGGGGGGRYGPSGNGSGGGAGGLGGGSGSCGSAGGGSNCGSGTANTGGGGAGANGRQPDSYNGAAGGSGIVIIRYKFQ